MAAGVSLYSREGKVKTRVRIKLQEAENDLLKKLNALESWRSWTNIDTIRAFRANQRNEPKP
ncbi:hypothetical protein [Paenibacillus apiarius]|uniref:Uncharacterized protein n=1 Tax=Paenibacillus apiarius TaxID=46240 RepID=A0ABT4DYA1_9BACL|nr:hypothetical protein [Paenibacillus apiarius]MCY9517810.1 hypothetical protein [Paenibacillus apiarius]MCY9522336.1 hypothetical protein [Paenibacillus apiarius]MCY9555115.1 hypothetical protein [Paenibacillus apiarius]MCY9558195.1 hypothetical protein [Paenibacillus apiarius]MCY9684595.1 hypothetical protein [Paenibacillus apiarius]